LAGSVTRVHLVIGTSSPIEIVVGAVG